MFFITYIRYITKNCIQILHITSHFMKIKKIKYYANIIKNNTFLKKMNNWNFGLQTLVYLLIQSHNFHDLKSKFEYTLDKSQIILKENIVNKVTSCIRIQNIYIFCIIFFEIFNLVSLPPCYKWFSWNFKIKYNFFF